MEWIGWAFAAVAAVLLTVFIFLYLHQKQQAQHQHNTSLSHDILSLFRVFTIIAHGVRHGKQKAPPSAVLFCAHYGW